MALLWAWLIAAILLVYAPLNSQRRFVEGVQVPLSILATVGLIEVVLPWLARTRAFQWIAARPRYSIAGLERLLIAAFLLLMSLSNVYVLASVSVTVGVQQPFPLFRAHDEIAAIDWLRANTSRSDIVMSAYQTGNYIAAHAGNRVVIGHWAETVDWDKKFVQAEQFYRGATSDEWRVTFSRKIIASPMFFGERRNALWAISIPSVRITSKKFLRMIRRAFIVWGFNNLGVSA